MSIYHISGLNPAGTARMQETMNPTNIGNNAIAINTTNPAYVSDIAASTHSKSDNEANPNRETVQKAIKVANEMLQKVNSVSLEYSVDETTHLEVVKVIDNNSGQTLKQIPSKDILGMISKMDEMWGILVDKKA